MGNRGQNRRGFRREQIPAVRRLCADIRESERGKVGDRIGPRIKSAFQRTIAAKTGFHLYGYPNCVTPGVDVNS